MNIYILHEQGAKKHYRALSEMQEKKGVNVVFRELSVFKNLIRSIFRKDVILFSKQVVNAMFLLRLAVKRNDVLIVAIAPYDWRLLVVYKIIKKHKYYYHTSHTDWGYKSYPKKFLAQTKCSKNIWTKFIENSEGVFCATKKTSDEIAVNYTTDHSGPKEIISNGCNGYIFSEKLYVEKALEMINVLSYDDDLFLEIKSNAFKRGREYTAELIFERWNKLLRIS